MSDLRLQAESLANYLPLGRAFAAKGMDGTVTRGILEGLARELLRSNDAIEEFKREILPDQTILFIEEWESAVGIPDECFGVAGSIEIRRRNVLAKLVSLGVQTEKDFETLAAFFGVTVCTIPGSRHSVFPFTFPFVFFPNAKAAFHTIIINMPSDPNNAFPYTFPLTFGNADQALVQCLFRHLKPAHVDIMYVTGFPC